MLTKYARFSFVAAALAVFVSSASASPVMIDSFNDIGHTQGYSPHYVSMHTLDNDPASHSQGVTGLNPADTIWGSRHAYVEQDQTSPVPGFGSADLLVIGGKLALGTNTALAPFAAKWSVSWTSPTMNSGVDLINDDGTPNTGFLIDFVSAEYDCRLALTVFEGGPQPFGRASTPEISVAASSSSQGVFVPFSDFTILKYTTSLDWTNVVLIGLSIHGAEDGDYEIDRIVTNAPEPGTMTLVVVGGIALIRRRRK